MDMWLHTILNDPKVQGSEYMPVVYYSNMRGVPLLSYTYLAKEMSKNGRKEQPTNRQMGIERI